MDIQTGNVNWEKARGIFIPEKESFLKKAQKTWEKYPQAHEALKIMAGLGVIGLGLIMPAPASLLIKELNCRERSRYARMWKRWEKEKIVEIDYSEPDPVVKITEKGIKRALRYKMADMKLKKPERWDKKWRVIIFDVAEEKRKNRDYFRENLINLGFYQLNESVFVHPFPCFDEVEYLRQMSGIGEEVTYMTVDSIETNLDLKNHFDLD